MNNNNNTRVGLRGSSMLASLLLVAAAGNDQGGAGRGIFFLDVSGEHSRPPILTRCAVESAHRHNPFEPITVYSDGYGPGAFSPTHVAIRPLRLYTDGAAATLSATPPDAQLHVLRQWLQTSEEPNDGYVYNNLADALRLALLYRSGGTNFDTDVISLRPLAELGGATNVVGWENEGTDLGERIGLTDLMVNNAAMLRFRPRTAFLRRAAERFVAEFNATRWGWQGTPVRPLPPRAARPLPPRADRRRSVALRAG